jgi:hypothetical protein
MWCIVQNTQRRIAQKAVHNPRLLMVAMRRYRITVTMRCQTLFT